MIHMCVWVFVQNATEFLGTTKHHGTERKSIRSGKETKIDRREEENGLESVNCQ